MEQKDAGLSTANIHGDPIDIEFISVTKVYGDVVALDNTNLKIARSSFHSLLGPSGCGKTTSLRLIAGFEQAGAPDGLIVDSEDFIWRFVSNQNKCQRNAGIQVFGMMISSIQRQILAKTTN